MALQAIRGKNDVLIEQFEQYEEAVKNNDTAVFETAKGEVAEAIRHINYLSLIHIYLFIIWNCSGAYYMVPNYTDGIRSCLLYTSRCV